MGSRGRVVGTQVSICLTPQPLQVPMRPLAHTLAFVHLTTSPWVLDIIFYFILPVTLGFWEIKPLCEVLVSGDLRVEPGSSDTAAVYYLSSTLTLLM